MVAALLGKKVGMTQVFDETGRAVPVTLIQAGPCTVLQVKTVETDGYDGVQLGFQDAKIHRSSMPQIGHAAKAGTAPKRFIREVRSRAGAVEAEAGEVWTVEVFDDVQYVDVTGTTKGRGFAGGMKRHGFGGQPASHGVERKHRSPGSIAGHGSDLGHGGNVKKGKRMAGHMGSVQRTTQNLELVGVDKVRNLLLVRGGVPGANGSYVTVKSSVTKGQPKDVRRLLFVVGQEDAPQPASVHRLVVFGEGDEANAAVASAEETA